MDKKTFDIILENYSLSDGDYEKKSWKRLAEELGFGSKDAIRKQFYREFAKQNTSGAGTIEDVTDQPLISGSITISTATADHTTPYKESVEMKADGSVYSDKLVDIFSVDYKNPASLLQAHGFNPAEWVLVSAKNNLWGNKYQSKIAVKPKVEEKGNWSKETVDRIFETLSHKDLQAVPLARESKEHNGKILILPISDLHLGLRASLQTCGNAYDLDIAEKLFFGAIQETMAKVSNQKFEEVVFVLGNDFLNSDNLSGTTSHGTPQDNADFWFALMDKAIEIIIRGVEMLRPIAKVNVLSVPSNHDEHSFYGIMKAVEAYFRNVDDVKIDTSPLPRKYYISGKNIICFTHDLNIKRALEVISTEAREYWSEANNVYLMMGHLHQAMQYEKQGVLEAYRLPTISGSSKWSIGNGFIQSKKVNQAFVLDDQDGIETVMNIVL